MNGDTIFALSTARGRSGVAVVRTSGPAARRLVESLTGKDCPYPRQVKLRTLSHKGKPIDHGLVLFFEKPASFTGEDMAEFQIHGGNAGIDLLSLALEELGARLAHPGEFSRRAFLNGKIDLTEAEAIADLIDAETEAQHTQAIAQADGGLRDLYQGWAARLSKARAWLEASLDFPDEDLPEDILEPVYKQIQILIDEITTHLLDARRGERLRTGVRVAILGAPNTGKSTLLNALAKRDIAIVSPQAGTTRDVLEAHLDLNGYPVIMADTAGLRETDDAIEQMGVARARDWATNADVKIVLVDSNSAHPAEDADLLVQSRCDMQPHARIGRTDCCISVHTGEGMDQMLALLSSRIEKVIGDMSRPPPTRERHSALLRKVLDALERFTAAKSTDVAAEELRVGGQALGQITGFFNTDALLDIIFGDFCIGK